MPVAFTSTLFNSWVTYRKLMELRGAAVPEANKFRLIICGAGTLTRTSTKADVLALELNEGNGYSRFNPVWASDGTYNTTAQRHEMPQVIGQWTPTGVSHQIQYAVLLADAPANSNKPIESVSGNTFTVTGHGLINGDSVMITADAGGSVPTPLSPTTIYTVTNTTANTFDLSGMTLTSVGSGSLRVRYANGRLMVLNALASPETVSPDVPYSIPLDMIEFNAAYGNGV